MARAMLIHNPVAARTKPRVVRAVCDTFSSEGWEVEVVVTKGPGDETTLARQGVAGSVDVIVVYGGDGTAIRAFSGMVGSDVPLGLIRGGTGNLLASNLGLPRNPIRAARAVTRGHPVAIDVGRLTCGKNERYFAVACGAGFDAELMARTSGESKRKWRMAAYVATAWEALGNLQPAHFQISVDDSNFEVEAATVIVANCGAILPPLVRFGPGITLDDGLLDVITMSASNRIESVSALWQMITGLGNGGRVRYARGRRITVESHPTVRVESDGDEGGTTPFTAEAVPGGLRIMMPRG